MERRDLTTNTGKVQIGNQIVLRHRDRFKL